MSTKSTSLGMLSDENRKFAKTLLRDVCLGRQADQVLVVVFGYGSYGDVLQITPLLHHLRRRIPASRLVLVHPNKAAKSLLKSSAAVDAFHVASLMVSSALKPLLASEGHADLLVNCRYVIEYILPESSRLGPSEKMFVEAAKATQESWLSLTEDFPHDNDQLWRTASASGLNMFSLMAETSGFRGEDFEALEIGLTPEDSSLRNELPDRYIVICNSAEALTVTRSTWTKTLPSDKMSRIAKKLKRFGLPMVLLGASLDDAPVDGVDYDLRGRSTLRQAAAILKESLLYVAPEGGIANLAKAVGKEGVVFFGSTPPAFFGFRDNINIKPQLCGSCWWTTPSYLYHCPRLLRVPECTQSVSEDEVIQGVRRLLK